MQQDQKVGLALGVLLIGTVAAFFFRNETHPARKAPTLNRAAEVDREIAEKNLTPYFAKQTGEKEAADQSPRAAADQASEPDVRTGERRLPSWDELQAEIKDPFAADAGLDAVPTPAPDPIQVESPATVGAEKTEEPTTPVVGIEPSPGNAETIHEVQRGDTLSSIAGKYLGSQAKFQEIFNANRDQLRDANDLKIGMKLHIPDGKSRPAAVNTSLISTEVKPAPAVAVETIEPVSDSRDIAPAAEPPKLKFSPAKRRPTRGPATP